MGGQLGQGAIRESQARLTIPESVVLKKPSSKIFGWASIVSSLIPWAAVCLSFVPGFSKLDLSATQIACFLAVGVVLAFVAAARGSGRWAFVALFDLCAVFFLVFILNLREPR